MPNRLGFTSSALIGQILAADLLTILIQKGIIAGNEVRELGDRALLTLEQWRAVFPGNQEDFDEARGFFERYARYPRTTGSSPPAER
jgi:hypothetical protein